MKNEESLFIKIFMLVLSSIVFFLVGFLLTLFIMIDKVYAAQVELDSSAFNIKAVKGNSTQNYGQLYLNTNYGDNGYNATCTGNYCTKYYSIYTNRAINSGTYTFELRFWFDYNSSYVTGLRNSDFRFYWGSNQNSITNQFTPENLSINTISYGAGGIWDAHQEYVITGNFTYSAANFLEIYIGDSRLNQTSMYITSLNIYSGDVSGMILSGLGDIVASNNSNTQNIISNNNTNTQSIINNQNSNNQNIISNNNTNTQSIINNQNSNAQATQEAIDEGFNECGYNLLNKSDWTIGGIASATGVEIVSTNRLRTKFIELDSSNTYKLISNLPYAIYYLFYYDSSYNFISRKYIAGGSINQTLVLPDNTMYLRIVLAKFNNGDVDNSFTFTNEDIFNLRTKLWSDTICQNRIDVVNDSINNIDGTLGDINSSITSSNVNVNSSDINSMNNNIGTNSVISDLLLLPVTLFQSILNSVNGTCVTFNLGSLFGHNLTMPCINVQSKIGSGLYGVIDILISGIFILSIRKKFVDIFNHITSLKDGGNELE